MAAAAVSLGNWQTRRGDAREALQAEWDRAERLTPVELRTEADFEAARQRLPVRVALSGELRPEATVFVDNRALDGAPGFQVVTPLHLANGAAVLVNRGWLPRDLADPSRLPQLSTPRGQVRIEGLAVPRVPRLLELASTTLAPPPAIWPNLEFEDVERATGLRLERLVVQQTNDTGDRLHRIWPHPSIGAEKNRAYALQWYGLAVLSAGLTAFFGGRAWLRQRTR
ncbi:MAG TPA: SURF1 family protein [Burkholderiaceae bacterium]|nr:SURF1 family protein [Burkholderiaceae bacterium]